MDIQGKCGQYIKSFKTIWFSFLGLQKKDFFIPEEFVQLGYPPNRIDIVTSCDGVEFETCYQSKKQNN